MEHYCEDEHHPAGVVDDTATRGRLVATHAPTSSPDTPYSAHRIYPQPHVDIYWIRAQRREAERSGQLLRQVLSKVIRRWYSAARFDVRRSMHEW